MNKRMKYIAIAALVVCMGAAYWLLQEGPLPEAPPEKIDPLPLSYIGNTLSEEKNGKKVWELTAEFIEIDPETNNTLLKNVKGVFYQQNGETVTMTAPQAIYDVKEKIVTITQRVKAVTSDGATLDANEVRWDSDRQKFDSEGDVKLTRGDTVLTGDKLESDSGFSKFKVTGNAHIVKGGKKE